MFNKKQSNTPYEELRLAAISVILDWQSWNKGYRPATSPEVQWISLALLQEALGSISEAEEGRASQRLMGNKEVQDTLQRFYDLFGSRKGENQ